MLTRPDFMSKKIITIFTKDNDSLSFKNDNLIVTDKNKKIKIQVSCYKIFAVFIVGGINITTGIIEKSKKFGFTILLFSYNFKLYESINFKMEGNTLLRKKQYLCKKQDLISNKIIINKIENQRDFILKLRSKDDKEIINSLNKKIEILKSNNDYDNYQIMGIEGSASKIYFKRIFDNLEWNGRQPRVKKDEINLLLDIGYTVLFNYIEAILNIYGFDIYLGNMHRDFYKRKSLVCDMVEPFRPIIDYKIRKAYNLGQLQYSYQVIRDAYTINYKDGNKFVILILEELINCREDIFNYIQQYYRWIMKEDSFEKFPIVRL